MIDMDGFKQLNDGFGHQVGDQLLMAAGKVIHANLRTMDIAARYGGDEFVLLIPGASIEQATEIAARISAEFKQTSSALLKRPTPVSMSVGVATVKNHGPTGADQLVTLADQALYRAKEQGRDCIASAPMLVAQHAEPVATVAH